MNLLMSKSGPLAFDQVNVDVVNDAVQSVMAACREHREAILSSASDDVQNRLIRVDDLGACLDLVLSPIYLLKEVHPDKEIREACQKGVETLINFDTELDLDEELYASLKEFSEQQVSLSPVEQRFLKKRMDAYLRNGFQLDNEKREELKKLDERINQKQLLFERHIAEGNETLNFREEEMAGLPEHYRNEHRQDDGSYKVTTSYPDYVPFMKYAKNEAARRRFYMIYINRAKATNIDLLDEIIKLRVERSKLLGFDSFAAYQLEDKMAGSADQVWGFIKDLSERIKEKSQGDYQHLVQAIGKESVASWDKAYATQLYKASSFKLNEEEVKPYFSLDRVLEGLFDLSQQLFSVTIKEVTLPVWEDSVRSFEVEDEAGEHVGRFYLDLYPRDNKYSHAACFSLRTGKLDGDQYHRPDAVLVCNFPKPTATRPSLLSHDDVETMFHEFGHLLHQLLTTSPLWSFAGTNVARDFVEMPSQILENWVWEKEALKRFARHHETNEPIPDELIDRMLAVKHLNSGVDSQQQLLYAALDMTYHDGFLPEDSGHTTRIYQELVSDYTLFAPVPGAHMQASFGHLIGYAAGYYGYLWSKVYALDMFSRFKKEGIYSAKVGAEYRKVLAAGNTVEPMALMEDFLGRSPGMDAFLEFLGV